MGRTAIVSQPCPQATCLLNILRNDYQEAGAVLDCVRVNREPATPAGSPGGVEVARDLGLEALTPRILKNSNNTIVHLAPAPVVAKVGTSHFRGVALETLERELAVARHLAGKDVPIVRPTRDVPAGPYEAQGSIVTLWQFYEAQSADSLGATELATRLRAVHEALRDITEPLPPFLVELEDAARLLSDLERRSVLPDADLRLLQDVHVSLRTHLISETLSSRPLHGSPHEGNWLATGSGPLLLDFETACRGPLEWDLSALGDDVASMFPGADRDLLAILRRMRSLCVAVKCWIEPDRAPEVFEAAHVHLRLLRGEPVS